MYIQMSEFFFWHFDNFNESKFHLQHITKFVTITILTTWLQIGTDLKHKEECLYFY